MSSEAQSTKIIYAKVPITKSVLQVDSRIQLPRAELKKQAVAPGAGAQGDVKIPLSCRQSTTTPKQQDPIQSVPYKGQDFYKLRAECIKAGKLFEDPEFPATDSSIFFNLQPKHHPLVWLRPTAIKSNPRFIVGDRSRFDIKQGELGDCWLLASVASLAMHEELIDRVAPRDQDFPSAEGRRIEYAGIFHFRFWQYGQWVDVVVDDRLPTHNRGLVYLHSPAKNEFWPALLEKAYAKLNGSYEALKGGSSSEAMVDFTGGITEIIHLKNPDNPVPPNLYEIMYKANKRCCLMGCSIKADPNVTEKPAEQGLIMGHAYSITDVRHVQVSEKHEKVSLIRIRNPWGDQHEWNGPWSDGSKEWNDVSPVDRKKLGLTFDSDGEFWMSFDDFMNHFEKLEICHLGPASLVADHLSGLTKPRFSETNINGSWVQRVSAGGHQKAKTFFLNPQYHFSLPEADDSDAEKLCTVIVGLMQKDRRRLKNEVKDGKTQVLLPIGYAIFQAPNLEANGSKQEEAVVQTQAVPPLGHKYFHGRDPVARCSRFTPAREVTNRHRLPPGQYVLVPCTHDPEQEANFLLRIYSDKPNSARELDQPTQQVVQNTPEKQVKHLETLSINEDLESPPPDSDSVSSALQSLFEKTAGADGLIDASELRQLLNNTSKKEFASEGFSLEAARSMLALYDVDQSGKLSLDEFRNLWADVHKFKQAFKKFDADKSGNLSTYELREAYQALDINLSNRTFQSLVQRYASKEGFLTFDDFVLATARLRTLLDTSKAQSKDQQGRIVFDPEQFLHVMLYI